MKKGTTKKHVPYIILLCLIISSCTERKEITPIVYQAVKQEDTATLSIKRTGQSFYGTYEIKYGCCGRDYGTVRGKLKGDTLVGDYFYKPDGYRDKKRVPFAVLNMKDSLYLGKGVAMEFLQIPYYSPDEGINFENPKFTFYKIKDSISVNPQQ